MTDTASAAPTLLPCPFCGNANAIMCDDLLTFHVGCLSCGVTGGASSYRNGAIDAWNTRAQPTPPAVVEPPELSPDFTDTARAALLWVLWHHQGGSSPVGQPIRFALGMGQHDRLNEHQLAEAKRWERLHPVNPAVFPHGAVPLTDEQIEKLRRETFSTENPFCPCDSKTMRKAVWAAERAHGIDIKKGSPHD